MIVFEEVSVPLGQALAVLAASGDNLRMRSVTLARQPKPASVASVLAKVGGEAGIRTLGTTLRSYNGLANRRLQPLGHLTATRKLSINEIGIYGLSNVRAIVPGIVRASAQRSARNGSARYPRTSIGR